jgi:hypothetical protein
METLNVRTNKLATDGLNIPGDPSTLVTLIPSSKLALRTNHTDITAKYATHLCKAATTPAMLKQFQTHYAWDKTDFLSVDWTAHHGAMQKMRFSGRKFIIKFIHQDLPMGEVFHKIDPTQSITCSSCKAHPECEAHLYQCPARCVVMHTFLQERN